MALNEPSSQSPETQGQSTSQAATVAQHTSAESSNSGGSPVWVVPLYMFGLALLFLGQRVLVEFDRGKLIASGLGLGALLAATAARFVLGSRASLERKRIEVLLGLLSVAGLLAIALYFASTDGGIDKIGFAAATREYKDKVQGVLQVAWVVLLCLSTLPMLFAEAALYPMRRGPELEVRRVAAAAASGATLAFAAAYGALFVFSASVATVQADFSYFKTSDPGESTIKMVESLDAPLKVTAFFPEVNEVRRELGGYFAKLAKHSKKIEFSFHDRYLEPKLATDLKISADGTVVLEKGEAKRVIVLGTDMKTVQPKLKTWDKEFQGLLNKVIRSNRTAYMTVGHGELNDEKKGISRNQGRVATIFKQILQQQNYVVRNLGLTDGLGSKVPDDAAIVMVLGPLEPFAPEEIATLRRYVEGGGSVFFAFDTDAFESNESAVDTTAAADPKAQIAPASSNEPAKPAKSPLTTSIEQLVGLVGLTFDGSVLANQVRHMQRAGNESDNIILMTNRFSSHASVSTLSRNASQAAVVM
ncbi:MAG TPA: Gldg family protein, partial [Polyangiaceae bacterium]|nr:Gldg family protein [Polyangiaceae bacterium]